MTSVIGEMLCVTFFQVCDGFYQAWWLRSTLTVTYGQHIIACADVTVHVQLLQVSLNRYQQQLTVIGDPCICL
jgi:hypothetical protein